MNTTPKCISDRVIALSNDIISIYKASNQQGPDLTIDNLPTSLDGTTLKWTIKEGSDVSINFANINCSGQNKYIVDFLIHYALSLVLECNINRTPCDITSINKKIENMVGVIEKLQK